MPCQRFWPPYPPGRESAESHAAVDAHGPLLLRCPERHASFGRPSRGAAPSFSCATTAPAHGRGAQAFRVNGGPSARQQRGGGEWSKSAVFSDQRRLSRLPLRHAALFRAPPGRCSAGRRHAPLQADFRSVAGGAIRAAAAPLISVAAGDDGAASPRRRASASSAAFGRRARAPLLARRAPDSRVRVHQAQSSDAGKAGSAARSAAISPVYRARV
jgi:hypothetical protein